MGGVSPRGDLADDRNLAALVEEFLAGLAQAAPRADPEEGRLLLSTVPRVDGDGERGDGDLPAGGVDITQFRLGNDVSDDAKTIDGDYLLLWLNSFSDFTCSGVMVSIPSACASSTILSISLLICQVS